jgi:3',5'-cyclic-AMP phosphodiesterase
MLTFIHISDTHFRDDGALFYDVQPETHFERFIAHVNAFRMQPDFVLHTGDVTNDRGASAYTRVAALCADLRVPVYWVNGNHDDRALMRQILNAPFDASGDPDAPLDYTFEVAGELFVVLDGVNAEVRDPLGKLRPEQLDHVRALCTPDGPPLTVILHYPPFKMGSPWLDENMPLVNGADLHAALLPARDRLRGVFFGHLHRSCQIVRDGIVYTSAASLSAGYGWRPWDERPAPDTDYPPGYNVVQYDGAQVIVHQYALPRA